MEPVPGCVKQHVAQTLCSQKQHKNQEMAASRCNCTARVAQRSGIDVCLFRWLDPSNRCCRLYLAVMACCKPCAYGSSEQPADSGRPIRVVNLLVHVCTYACLFCVDAVKHTQQAVPGCVGLAHKPCAGSNNATTSS
jgi:hypothetical protein